MTEKLVLVERTARRPGTSATPVTGSITAPYRTAVNPLMGTSKSQSNAPQYDNTVIGTQAVDEWAISYIRYSDEGTGLAAGLASALLLVCLFVFVLFNFVRCPCNVFDMIVSP